jgi:SAM-dependent methyltransferase
MTVETLPKFTAHNVRLDDGTETFPSIGYTMDQNPITLCVKRLMHALYPDGFQNKTVIDVGCLEGGFATEFARLGMEATGVEVRESNYNNCLYVRDRVNLPNLHFIQGDAMDIAKFGRFDVYFVSGLLYHLDQPRKFLQDVAANCNKALVLWTHVSHAEDNAGARHYSLSGLCENEGLMGRWYSDHEDVPQSALDSELKWASWNNQKSFWVQKEYLLQLLKDIGFDLVFEQFDCMDDIVGDMTEGFYNKIDRVLLVAVKTGLPLRPVVEYARPRKPATPPAQPSSSVQPPTEPVPDPELIAAKTRVLAVERDLALAQARLREVHASTSWRLTGPLRRVSSLLRGERPGA